MLSSEKQEVLRLFAEGRRQYKLMDFNKAREFFESALALDKEDGPSKVYYYRCQHYMQNPPPEDWDGVFVMDSK
jgi:hypothetical protein